MGSNLIAITVVDVNRSPVPEAEVKVIDAGSISRSELTPRIENTFGKTYHVYDPGNLHQLEVTVKGQQFFEHTVKLELDFATGTIKTNRRSADFGLVGFGGDPGLHWSLELVARRVRPAPRSVASAPSTTVREGEVIDDLRGVWIDASKQLVALFDNAVSNYPVLVNKGDLNKNPAASDWDRFNHARVSLDPNDASAGHRFEWLEYGDPNGLRFLVAVWALHGAGSRPDRKVDLLFFFSPRTDIPPFKPADVYPYKRKQEKSGPVQPYPFLAYRYLTPGRDGKDFGLAYQAMACSKSMVIVMPIQKFGDWGPLIAQDGLNRLAREVVNYVGDTTGLPLLPASVPFGTSARQILNRIATAGYSAGVNELRKLLAHDRYRRLADTYEALARQSAADGPGLREAARQLRLLPELTWASPADQFQSLWKEFYSVDGFFGDKPQYKQFQNELADWFQKGDERRLRLYATDGRIAKNELLIGTKLQAVFAGVSPGSVGGGAVEAQEWHRKDGRATVAWFTEKYMNFTGVPFMPEFVPKDQMHDAHHTIPRVVFSHAVSQSGLLPK